MAVLPDVLNEGLNVVFCGTAVGRESAEVGAYYANTTNVFWRTLHEVGLTPRQLTPSEYMLLPQYGIGLTDLAKYRAGNDDSLCVTDFDPDTFRRKIEAVRPRTVAFNGKKAAAQYLGRDVEYGQLPEMIGGTALFVLPSTSGAARRWWDEKHWMDLAIYMKSS